MYCLGVRDSAGSRARGFGFRVCARDLLLEGFGVGIWVEALGREVTVLPMQGFCDIELLSILALLKGQWT